MLQDENVFYFPSRFMTSGADSLPIEVVVNMVEKNMEVYYLSLIHI